MNTPSATRPGARFDAACSSRVLQGLQVRDGLHAEPHPHESWGTSATHDVTEGRSLCASKEHHVLMTRDEAQAEVG